MTRCPCGALHQHPTTTPAREAKRARRRDEEATQRAIVQWLELGVLREGVRYWHTPNGGARSKAEAAILKAMGTKAGVPDLAFAWSERRRFTDTGRVSRIAFMEVKTGRGSLSTEQREFRHWCLDNEIPWVIVRSLDDAMDVLRGWRLLTARAGAGQEVG